MFEKILACVVTATFIPIFAVGALAQVKMEKATFAGGCFWCMTPPFEKLNGVMEVISGYTAGSGENPTYHDYAEKGYVEAVQVTYDPSIITYSKLLDVFWRQIDPTDPGGQFCDRGAQYRAAVFYHDEQQKKLAQESKAALEKSGRFKKSVVTEIMPTVTFYPAEEYHQDYYKKNPVRYEFYRFNCGRDRFLKKYWGNGSDPIDPSLDSQKYKKPGKEELKKRLTPLQYKVTQENGTELAFHNKYWNNHKEGIYVDIVSGEPLFSSTDKFDSNTGWPSFNQPLEPKNILEKVDRAFFMTRTEVRSTNGNSHLGHVFNDGPAPMGKRYCINSAALRFIPKEDLKKEGYAEYKKLFSSPKE